MLQPDVTGKWSPFQRQHMKDDNYQLSNCTVPLPVLLSFYLVTRFGPVRVYALLYHQDSRVLSQ